MAGIGYNSKIIIYNQAGTGEIGDTVTFYGTALENVRLEWTEAKSISTMGEKNANRCTAKIYDLDMPKAYVTPETWQGLSDKTAALTFDKQTFFIITDKSDIGINNVPAPTGAVSDSLYADGFKEYLITTYGGVFEVNTIDHYSLIPHWEIGGK